MVLQVVAMGGYEIPGPFGPPSALERYLLEAAGVSTPRVCFLGTASGDSPETVARFYEICEVLPCEPSHLALFHDRDVEDLDAFSTGATSSTSPAATPRACSPCGAHGLDRARAASRGATS